MDTNTYDIIGDDLTADSVRERIAAEKRKKAEHERKVIRKYKNKIIKIRNKKADGKYHEVCFDKQSNIDILIEYIGKKYPDCIYKTLYDCIGSTLYVKFFDEEAFEKHANKLLAAVTSKFSAYRTSVYIHSTSVTTYNELCSKYNEFFERHGYKIDNNGVAHIFI